MEGTDIVVFQKSRIMSARGVGSEFFFTPKRAVLRVLRGFIKS
jgi:hypothetical protein